jgi:hypothetical protein
VTALVCFVSLQATESELDEGSFAAFGGFLPIQPLLSLEDFQRMAMECNELAQVRHSLSRFSRVR